MEHNIKEKFAQIQNSTAYSILKKLKFESKENPGIIRRTIFFSMITWLPLLILTLFQGTAINPDIKIPFLLDYVTYVRFLVSLPFLFVAEKFIRFEITNSLYQFIESGVIADNNVSKYESLTNKFNKLQSSRIIQVTIFILALVNIFLFRLYFAGYGEVSSWEYVPGDGASRSLAGYWFIFISLPIWQYLIFRMLLKFFLWTWFLWKISRMKLNLVASDPDKAGGLAFLGTAQISFGFLALAQSAGFSAEIANKVVYGGVPIENFKFTVLIALITVLIFYLFPLFFFMKQLTKIKLKGLLEYGALTHKYSHLFNEKWIKGNNPESEPLLGTGDIQSLADIGGSYERIQSMKIVPLSFRIVLFMIVLTALPMLPLVALKIPPLEILKSVAGFFL